MVSAKVAKTPKVGRDSPAYLLRLPESMRAELRREAEITDRSMNTIILRRLQSTYTDNKKYQAEQPEISSYYTMTEIERSLFAIIKSLSVERQLALISLLK